MGAVLAFVMMLGAAHKAAFAAETDGAKCDATCLTSVMDKYLENMVGNHIHSINLAPGALIFVNTQPTALREIPLTRVKAIKSTQIFCDPVTGNVIARTGVELNDGKIAYASTRLKVAGGAITQIETSFDDDKQSVVPAYVTFLDPLMTTIVPAKERSSRAELEALVRRYFQALTDHMPVAADYDDRCDRFHSGRRITHNAPDIAEGGRALTCFSSAAGHRPWGPATEIRIPVVDPEHGIVIGFTILLYSDNTPPMYVSEAFKILRGKIRQIDNIGLNKEGVKAMNFPN